MTTDLDTMTDEELDAHRVAVLTEIEQRQRIRDIPEQAEALAREYADLGGDRDHLIECVTNPSPEEVVEVVDDAVDATTDNGTLGGIP